jgi:predicted glutamine amidotransferase
MFHLHHLLIALAKGSALIAQWRHPHMDLARHAGGFDKRNRDGFGFTWFNLRRLAFARDQVAGGLVQIE